MVCKWLSDHAAQADFSCFQDPTFGSQSSICRKKSSQIQQWELVPPANFPSLQMLAVNFFPAPVEEMEDIYLHKVWPDSTKSLRLEA